MLKELLIALVAFLGLAVGYLLAFIAKEEIKAGQKYFLILRRAMAIGIAITLVTEILAIPAGIILFIIGALIGYFFRFAYLYLGLAFAAATTLPMNVVVLVAALIFLYGLPYGGSASKKTLLFHALLFFLPVLTMLLVMPTKVHLLLPFAAGALVTHH